MSDILIGNKNDQTPEYVKQFHFTQKIHCLFKHVFLDHLQQKIKTAC